MGRVTVVVIGAGQAGLSAAYHLRRRGFVEPGERVQDGGRTFVVLDANPEPGGAWQHRWESLRMATVNGIFDLPGLAKPPIDPGEPSRVAVPRYFEQYEQTYGLHVRRPVRVTAVRPAGPDLVVEAEQATNQATRQAGSDSEWTTSFVVNATGTWTNPVLPHYPGQETFQGQQLHTRDYVDARAFAGRRVAIVGGGISAVQLLDEISQVTRTYWYTRREPVFLDRVFMPVSTGRDSIAKVTADVEAGRPTGFFVSYTGRGWTPYTVAARQRGALVRRPMFTAIEPTGVREDDGSFTSVDVILWATGFRAQLAHLEPLHLRNELGGITMHGTAVAAQPRVHLIGFGPSQSTVGANRAGREAVSAIVGQLSAAGARTMRV
jgi:cation diffusion facilitator CzcD-associated flavoprotein CzcO